MKAKTITKTVYYVHLPYPNNVKFQMIECNGQPFFLPTELAKVFHLKPKQVIEIASPHLTRVMNTTVISLYGYWKVTLLGDSKVNRQFQHTFIHTALDDLYKDFIKHYLEIVQKSDKNAKDKSIKTTTKTFQ